MLLALNTIYHYLTSFLMIEVNKTTTIKRFKFVCWNIFPNENISMINTLSHTELLKYPVCSRFLVCELFAVQWSESDWVEQASQECPRHTAPNLSEISEHIVGRCSHFEPHEMIAAFDCHLSIKDIVKIRTISQQCTVGKYGGQHVIGDFHDVFCSF